jgi:hypothetical protein
MLDTLNDLGYDTSELITPESLLAVKLLMFENGIKIDVMMQVPGLDFATAWQHKGISHVDEQSFYLVSKADLIASKRAAGRQKDRDDIEALTRE